MVFKTKDKLFRIGNYFSSWRVNNKYHREDGPAIIYSNGYRAWMKNGVYHRIGAPAIINSDGSLLWYRRGDRYDMPRIKVRNDI